MGMMGGDVRRMYGGDTNKAANAGKTLARFAVYFRSHWVLLLAVVALAVGSTWAQVSTRASACARSSGRLSIAVSA